MYSKLKKKIKKKLKKYLNKFKKAYFRAAYYFFTMFPVKENAIAFLSDSRSDLSGNFEYIDSELRRRGVADTDIYYMLKRTNTTRKTFSEFTKLAWLIATSKNVLLDDFYPLVYPLKIRQNVNLIQVWHAVGAFKTFGFSRVGLPGGPKPTSKNHKNYTWAIVSSKNVAPFYAEGFGIDQNKVLPLGAPRTDMFFDETYKKNVVSRLENELPFIVGKKVILFAPTFRGNGQKTAYYNFDWIDFDSLYRHFYDKGYVFLFKIHPFVKENIQIPEEYADFFYDVSSYREINDLLLISDILVTDYSSVVFEYSLLRKKTLFFVPDLEEYTASRDFYVDYQEFVPGPIVRNTEQLVSEIAKADDFDSESLNDFLDYYFDDLDGQASKRFVDALENDFINYR
ncbi:CDP-glycerol glycerophosphotransferase family protein [Weissella confusa]|uniref:CDP-glycerol glycerophosphotransferase family protein n=1 Tax=Weissella confusa TaxID=1583 RepID=UPI00396F4BDA